VPLPEPPVRYAPILAAVWLLAGVVLMLTVRGAAGTPLLPLGSEGNAESVPQGLYKVGVRSWYTQD